MSQQNENNRITSTLAIVSLVTGILGVTILPIVGSIVAIITGHMAKNEIKKSQGAIDGNGMATGGLILGYLNIVLILVAFCSILFATLFTWYFGDSIIQQL